MEVTIMLPTNIPSYCKRIQQKWPGLKNLSQKLIIILIILMFSAITSFFSSNKNPLKTYKVPMIGPFQTGRTTILYRYLSHTKVQAIPTFVINYETVQVKVNVSKTIKLPQIFKPAPTSNSSEKSFKKYETTQKVAMKMWDYGGACKIRELYKIGYPESAALVYVVDVEMLFDDYKMSIVEQDLQNLVNTQNFPNSVPILFLINKTDLMNTVDELLNLTLAEAKQLLITKLKQKFPHHLLQNRNHQIMFCSAETDTGIKEAFSWIATQCLNQQ